MAVRHERFLRSDVASADLTDEVATVDSLADKLVAHLEASAAQIDLAHVHRASSRAIQTIVGNLLQDELGFRSEVVLTPVEGFITRARPDFVFDLGPDRGVIAEVERGGTTTNNHDLKDLWKAHIAPDVQHLFLIVPNANWNEEYGRRRALLGYAFRHDHETCRRAPQLHPPHLDVISDREGRGEERRELSVAPLLNFCNGILHIPNLVAGSMCTAPFEAWCHPCGGEGVVFAWEISDALGPRHPW